MLVGGSGADIYLAMVKVHTIATAYAEQGKVVAVGPGKIEDGKRVPMGVKVGDVVLFTKYGPNEIKVEGKEYLIAKEEDILAVIG